MVLVPCHRGDSLRIGDDLLLTLLTANDREAWVRIAHRGAWVADFWLDVGALPRALPPGCGHSVSVAYRLTAGASTLRVDAPASIVVVPVARHPRPKGAFPG